MGVKNVLVVTWLTNVNLYAGWLANIGMLLSRNAWAAGATLGQHFGKAPMNGTEAAAIPGIAQEPSPGDVILDRINFMGF